jgi:chemotaxis protein CheX
MTEQHILPFVEAVRNTFRTMLEEDPAGTRPRAKLAPFPLYDISGVIGISGGLVGSAALSFPESTALKVVSRFVQGKFTQVNPEVTDGIGELVNIVAGSALPGLEGYACSISLPTVVTGKSHALRSPGQAPSMVVAFGSSFGPFALEVTLRPPDGKARNAP